jgi:enterochelin esterase-like enzyme
MRTALIVVVTSLIGSTAFAQEASLTPQTLGSLVSAQPNGAEAEALGTRIRTAFGGAETLARGAAPLVDELSVAWALELPQPPAGEGRPPRVASDTGGFALNLTRIGTTNVYAGMATLSHGTAFTWHYEVGNRRFGGGQLEVYTSPPEAREQPGVPKGTVRQMTPWQSKIFPHSTREWWIYVPAQYRPETPAAVMVFQDGAGPKDYVPVVFDNLIARGDMPVTVGIFIQPGVLADKRPNRSFEYDTLSDQYARLLIEEMLPEVEKTVRLRRDPANRAIAGMSSGGIAAFTVAWERPNEFGKVLSWVGSFTNIASGASGRDGGHNYAAIVRKTPKKPIRVFLQDGANDLDNAAGNWTLANLTMAKSLAYAGYDYRFEFGQGFHSVAHGRAILPDSLRWLWRDWRDSWK